LNSPPGASLRELKVEQETRVKNTNTKYRFFIL
jgi:hypothetical protein